MYDVYVCTFRTTNELMLSTHVPSKVTRLTKLHLASFTFIRALVRVSTHVLAKRDGYRNTFSQTSHSCCVLFLFDPFLKAGFFFSYLFVHFIIIIIIIIVRWYLQTQQHRFFFFFFFPLFSLTLHHQNRPRIFRAVRMRILSSHTSRC